jgi:nicotinamide mononucleotide (NMN) deamidase PncC
LLEVPDAELEGVRPSTEAYIAVLAEGIKRRLETPWVLAESGATGPTGNRYGDAPGHACYAVLGPNVARTHTLETGDDDRVANMFRFARTGLEQLDAALS